MPVSDILKDAESRMKKSVESAASDFATLRTGRANPAILDSLEVEYYGQLTPLNQVAAVASPDPRILLITPWEKGALKAIEKAIMNSDLGLAPNNDGKVIRLTVPAMSGDQRKKMVQHIKKLAEAQKVSCRNVRRDANKHFDDAEKAGEMTEDDRDKGKEKVQDLLKSYEAKIDDLADKKAKEVMEQ